MNYSADRRLTRAQRYLADGQVSAARIALESLLQRDSGHSQSLLMLSSVARIEGRVRDATEYALAATRNMPADGSLAVEAAETLRQQGETVMARRCLDHPALAGTTDGHVLVQMAVARKLLGEHEEALALLNRAAASGMSDENLRFERAQELMFHGRLDEAEVELQACLHLSPCHGQAALALARVRQQTPQENHLQDLRQRLREVESGTENHAALEFAIYKELEDLGQYNEAWDSLARANALMYARQRHNPGYARQVFDGLIDRCTPQFLAMDAATHEGPQPIFIIGMPRSGTTLLERVLSNHSQITSAGELNEFGLQLRWVADHGTTLDEYIVQKLQDLDYAQIGRRYLEQTQWRARGARFFIDKLPRNWMVAGLIRRALPQARILHLVRDPMDVCFSNFRTLVMGDQLPWGYDLHALSEHYLQYRNVMNYWHAAMPARILDVPYGELTSNPEAVTRELLAHCGLEWEDGCADITRNKAAVATLSLSQVREGIHTRFFEEWRNYEQQLLPLRQAVVA